MTIPRSLHVVSLSFMALLLAAIVLFVVGYAAAGPEENLAGVLLIFAAVLAVPLLVALALWSTGVALRDRAPRTAYGLVVSNVVVGGIGALAVGIWLMGLVMQFVPAG